jgi:hypothetical protein
MSNFLHLEPLSMDKTTVFFSPLEGDDVLVRTGVASNKHSIYHALSHACSDDYVEMNEHDSKKFVHNLTNTNETMLRNLKNFYAIPAGNRPEVRELLKDMIPYDDFVSRLCNSVKKTQHSMKKFIKPLLEDFKDDLGEKIMFLKTELSSLIDELAMSSLITDIALLSENFNKNIFIIDEKTRMPIVGQGQDIESVRESVVVICMEGHYEVVGRLMPRNRIKRTFGSDDVFIKKFVTVLWHPNNLTRYPELIDFVSDEVRKTHNLNKLPRRRYKRSPLKSPEGSRVESDESEEENESDA